MVEATKLPVKVEKKAAAPAHAPMGWSPMDLLRREIDQVFEDMMPAGWGFPLARAHAGWSAPRAKEAAWALSPAVDVTERDKDFEITAELPGLSDKDIDVKLANGILVIKGEKKEERDERRKDYHLTERRYGSFVRSFAVPDHVDADKIEATFANGVLRLTLPKSAQALAGEKKIAVKAA